MTVPDRSRFQQPMYQSAPSLSALHRPVGECINLLNSDGENTAVWATEHTYQQSLLQPGTMVVMMTTRRAMLSTMKRMGRE